MPIYIFINLMTLTTILSEFKFNEQPITVYGDIENPLFICNEIGKLLKMSNLLDFQKVSSRYK